MKKILTLMLSGIVLAASIPSSSQAAMVSSDTVAAAPSMNVSGSIPIAVTEPTNQSLEAAIKAVKSKITIPKEYSEFNYYFNTYSTNSVSFWSFNWRNPDTNSYIEVNCDTDHHITYFYQYISTKEADRTLPQYLKKELKDSADSFIKKIAPEVAGKLQYMDSSYDGIYSGCYTYVYQRVENGIPFPENTVTVSVNSTTGQIRSASVQWLYDAKIPASATKISKDDAAKIIKDKMKMELTYRTDYMNIYVKGPGNDNATKNAYLVYQPANSYISVDANSGAVYLNKSEWQETDYNGQKSMATADTGSEGTGSSGSLTDEEIAKVEELKNLISKEDAIKKITGNKSLYLDANIKAYSATLNKWTIGNGKSTYVWNISLSDPRPIDNKKGSDNYRAYANATVDAETGIILNFNASTKSYYDEVNKKWNTVKIAYDKAKGQAILESFLNAQIKNKFSNTRLTDQSEGYIAYYKNDNTPVYGGYSYRYERVYQNIPYSYNSIYGSVDGVTGKIYNYSYNWDDNVTFQSPSGIISADKAMDAYLSKDGYQLQYEINVVSVYSSNKTSGKDLYESTDAVKVVNEVRLVYSPQINPSFISPFTGEQLDNNGKVYVKDKPYTYLDIADTKENRNILLLADMNIGFEGENFEPAKAITKGEMNSIFDKIGYGNLSDTGSTSGQQITRQELAKFFVNNLGLEKISNIPGIYKTGYDDEASIGNEYLGAVALAKGYHLITADSGNNFNPTKSITRMEAVNLILNYIAVQQKGIY